MKNLSIIAAMLSCLVSYAQLQNANWYFGHHCGLTFLPDPYNPAAISSSQIEGALEASASVSDNNGNLLFYTNAEKVWNASNTVMPHGDGLLGDTSCTQGAVIVPKPGDSNNYYIFTLSGGSSNHPSPLTQRRGLHYSEVDMAINDVISTVKNIPLKDEYGTLINPAYYNTSEKMTTARHSNGVDYWVVVYIKDKIYSYLVSSAGVSLLPVSSNAPLNIPNVSPAVFEPLVGRCTGQMKISPDGKKIGVAYGDLGLLPGDEYGQGAITLGTFDTSTGHATFSGNLIQPYIGYHYGLEFSPSSNYVYFNAESRLYRGDAFTATTANVTMLEETGHHFQFQLAVNGKIYTNNYNAADSTPSISVINDPDDALDPNVQSESVPITTGTLQLGFPAWVHWQNQDCQPNATFNIPELNFVPYIHKYQNYIITNGNYSVAEGQNITLQAGNYVLIKPNTYIKPGSIFLAHIDDCESESKSRTMEEQQEITENTTGLKLYPNPANDIVSVASYNNPIQHITVVSLDGKTIYDKDTDKTNIWSFNVKEYIKGIYIVTVQTANGMIHTEKLVIH